MTDKQLAAYLEMLAGRLVAIKRKLVLNLDGIKLERHPETHEVQIPFSTTKLRMHPHADQPVCLDDLEDFIFELYAIVRNLKENPPKKEYTGGFYGIGS